MNFRVHNEEALSLDWNKYNSNILATGSSARCIRVWDIRNAACPLFTLEDAHTFPVKKVRWSPFDGNILASASYDMSVAIWEMKPVC